MYIQNYYKKNLLSLQGIRISGNSISFDNNKKKSDFYNNKNKKYLI